MGRLCVHFNFIRVLHMMVNHLQTNYVCSNYLSDNLYQMATTFINTGHIQFTAVVGVHAHNQVSSSGIFLTIIIAVGEAANEFIDCFDAAFKSLNILRTLPAVRFHLVLYLLLSQSSHWYRNIIKCGAGTHSSGAGIRWCSRYSPR